MTFGTLGRPRWTQFYLQNFFTYDVDRMLDYFCIPDDLVLAYGGDEHYQTRAGGLAWTLEHGLDAGGARAHVTHRWRQQDGLHEFVALLEREHGLRLGWRAPPLRLAVTHTMVCDAPLVPMRIDVENLHDHPLRVVYVLQDGAWMRGASNQDGIRQVWPDAQPTSGRVRALEASDAAQDRWFGLYHPAAGGMFAGIWAPPASDGVRLFATWCSPRFGYLDGAGFDSDRYELRGGVAGVPAASSAPLRLDDLFDAVEPDAAKPFDASDWKIAATVVDFGELPPGSRASQTVVKVMLSPCAGPAEAAARIAAHAAGR